MLRSRILEGIDALRLRKCRPDRESIAHHVLRKYGTQFNEIFNELEVIVDEEILVKVEYKGSISYRLPSSFDTKASPLLTKHSKILNSVKTTRFILAAVNELLSANESYSVSGIPADELKSRLEQLSPERFQNNKSLIAIEREVLSKNGNLLKSSKGRIYPKDLPIPPEEIDPTDGGTKVPIPRIPQKRKPNETKATRGRKPKKLKVNDPDPDPIDVPVFAVKSKPNEVRTYEGKFFTLVGSVGSEPPTATATGFIELEEESPGMEISGFSFIDHSSFEDGGDPELDLDHLHEEESEINTDDLNVNGSINKMTNR